MNNPPKISLAIPVYNEREVFPQLLARVRGVVDQLPGGPHEIVIVDDGSKDGTADMLAAAAKDDPRIVAVCFSRNFGHQTAITAALDHVTGDVVVVMDGDLQDEPEVIPQLLARYAEGYDVVYTQRASREEAWWLQMAYRTFYRVAAALADIRLPLDSGDFALLSRRVVDAMRSAPERRRYLRGLRTWVGFRQTSFPLNRPARAAGVTKYSLTKLMRLALDGIFAFSSAPLRLITTLGLSVIGAVGAFVMLALVAKIFGRDFSQFSFLIAVIALFSGVQLTTLGVIGGYIGRIYDEVKGRPHYVVDRVIRHGAAEPR